MHLGYNYYDRRLNTKKKIKHGTKDTQKESDTERKGHRKNVTQNERYI